MFRKIATAFILIGWMLSACAQAPAAEIQADVQPVDQAESVDPSPTSLPTEVVEAPTDTPAALDGPLAALKGKMVNDEEGYLLLLGFVNSPNAEINYQFPESYQFPHEHIKDDLRILDSSGAALEFEEIDPGELNLYVENPLGEGIIDPRAFRLVQKEIQGPLTLEMVNLIQGVNVTEPANLSFDLQFDAGFPLGENQWNIDQTIDVIPEHPFTMKYFDATVFNDYNQGKYTGPQSTFFNGSYYLEAAGFEGITFGQIVPENRLAEMPMGGGGYEQACAEVFANCVMSDAGLLKTEDNVYQLQITAYRLIIQGPWQVQFDLPE
ncbi:MAG TPA: hypothetical protein VHO48_03595 [Anaerolineaceae bacterium]|nr:hypothetical protein [Anaerolineaceae bacterium]